MSETLHEIDEIYAWVSDNPNGRFGIVAEIVPGMGHMPFVSQKKSNMEKLRPMVNALVEGAGREIRLVRFSHPEIIETVTRKQ